MQDDEVVRLLTADNPAQAHVWQQALENEGIYAQVVGDYLDAGLGDLPGLRAELWVYRKDVQRAERVLAEHRDAMSAADKEAAEE
jgi:hypothetical protein